MESKAGSPAAPKARPQGPAMAGGRPVLAKARQEAEAKKA